MVPRGQFYSYATTNRSTQYDHIFLATGLEYVVHHRVPILNHLVAGTGALIDSVAWILDG